MTRLPDPRDRPWLTVDELAEITGEGPKAIRSAVARGQLPRIDVGRYVRIPTAALYERCRIPLPSEPEEESPSESSEREPGSSRIAPTSLEQEVRPPHDPTTRPAA